VIRTKNLIKIAYSQTLYFFLEFLLYRINNKICFTVHITLFITLFITIKLFTVATQ